MLSDQYFITRGLVSALPQLALLCPCGRAKIHAKGFCANCRALQRQDQLRYDGQREAVLRRDGHRCRVCGEPAAGVRTIAVHHRRKGGSKTRVMISLCLPHHAMVTRTRVGKGIWEPLLLKLWAEQHPDAPVQLGLGLHLAERL